MNLKKFAYCALISIEAAVLLAMGSAAAPKLKSFLTLQEEKRISEQKLVAETARYQELQLKQEKFRSDRDFVQKIAHEHGFAHEDETIYQFDTPAKDRS